ncbi:BON domain-containing protein [Thioalkalivibrio sp. XN8]|uniref:BON domain-containing protein n=1 Tax=Thioalkalivibrio sp. XN8 TaxID=2712863 RepID=UPI0013E9C9DB|nr:BON domain-containing protein [Thioalkalivibrio sp. XN8]NGP52573.1 BON domain-containing protein [Thioalkalivibrio sp. XN8]
MLTKFKQPLVPALALCAVALAAGGCVVVVDGEGVHRGKSDVEWAKVGDSAPAAASAAADGALAREVRNRFEADTALAGEDITVSSSGDVVTLHGRLGEPALLEHALRVAAEVPGVTRVVSRLTIEMEGQ